MIPLAAIPWRLVGYGLAVAAVLGAGWWLNGRLDRANEADRLERERDAYAESIRKAGEAVADYAQATAKIERERDAARTALDGVRAEQPRTLIQTREVIVNGKACPAVSVGPDFVRLWNDAASAYDSMP